MLMGFMPMGGMLKRDATVSYAGLTASADITSPSLTVPIGAVAADRYIIAVVFEDNTGSTPGVITSMTIGGVSCTKVVQTAALEDTALAIFVTDTAVASGTTATLAFTGSAVNTMAFATYAAYGINPTSTASSTATADDPSTTINVPAGGIMIAASINDTSTNTCTWTGITPNFDSAYDPATRASGGSYTTDIAVTSRTVTASWSSSDNDKLVVAAWGPA
jgi:hypothetical protein